MGCSVAAPAWAIPYSQSTATSYHLRCERPSISLFPMGPSHILEKMALTLETALAICLAADILSTRYRPLERLTEVLVGLSQDAPLLNYSSRPATTSGFTFKGAQKPSEITHVLRPRLPLMQNGKMASTSSQACHWIFAMRSAEQLRRKVECNTRPGRSFHADTMLRMTSGVI